MIRRGPSLDGEAAQGAGQAHALAILHAALDAVITIDHLGRVLEFNRAAEETFGYRREDVLGQELAELVVPPELREAHRQALARWTAAGPTAGAGGLLGRRLEVQAMRSDGFEFPAELAISRVDVHRSSQPAFAMSANGRTPRTSYGALSSGSERSLSSCR